MERMDDGWDLVQAKAKVPSNNARAGRQTYSSEFLIAVVKQLRRYRPLAS